MGTVWRAYDRHLQARRRRQAAAPVDRRGRRAAPALRPRGAGSRSARARAHRPALRLRRGRRDAVPRHGVRRRGEPRGRGARSRRGRGSEASELARPIASALAYAHARGIVHRDLTPGNVLIESATGRVVVSDFGLARIARSSTSVTTQGMLLGTPEYWSPEQARGLDSETATDLYALGCLLFWLLAGRTPFEGDDRLAVGLRRAHEAAPSLAIVRSGCPSGRRRDSSTPCSPSNRPNGRPRSRCSSSSVSRGRRSPMPPPSRSRRRIATTAVFGAAPVTAVLEPPTRHAARKRRRGRRMVAVVVAIAAAGALAFVGATIANADRDRRRAARDGDDGVAGPRRDSPRRLMSTSADAPLVVGGRPYSESVRRRARIVSQMPRRGRARRADGRSISSSGSVAARRTPRCRTSRGRSSRRRSALSGRSGSRSASAPRSRGRSPRGASSRATSPAGDEARRPGPIGIVVSSGPPRAPVPDVRGVGVDDAAARLDGSFDTDVVDRGLDDGRRRDRCCARIRAPGDRAVLGSTVTLTVARAPEWATTWSESGCGDFDSEPIEVTAPQGEWRIVVELDPRYLIFGSGSAIVSWEGTGAGQIALDRDRLRRGRAAERRRDVHGEGAPARERQLDGADRAARLAGVRSDRPT